VEAEQLTDWIAFCASRLHEYGLNSDFSSLITHLERNVPKLKPLLIKWQELKSQELKSLLEIKSTEDD
jgi:hypothetical protein